MKKQIKSLLLAFVLLLSTTPMWGQASTQGKDFWLATTIVCQPPSASKPAVPYIAISTKEACVVSITDYQGNSVVKQHGTSVTLNQIPLGAGSWTEFGNTDASVQLYDIDASKWYPTTNVTSAGDVYKHADEKNRYGLHVTSDKDISVFVVLRATNSMDASNILPVTAIQSEYYTQDYWPYAKDVSTNVTMSTILAIEDNTVVDITPKGDTYGKNNSGQTFNITLNKGETYYLMSKSGEQLAGTHIQARNDKKIAVYNGCPLTTVPVMVTARDGMYEQSMPVDYWGTEFIVTRSKDKDGNIIGITAAHDGTSVYVDGYYRTTIERAGDTYYCMLQSSYNPNSKKPGDKPLSTADVFTADVAYIQTSCPCAVYSYDTGNSFVYSKDENENLGTGDDRYGDPSSVWISPIQQTIGEITFGTCYTNKTKMHYLNVVTETATCQQTTLAYRSGTTMNDCSSLLNWTVVSGNPKYSYSRTLISNDESSKNVFTLKNPKGFIAHIYGNGDDESYAYSAGSAAVEQGVKVNRETFVNGYRSDSKFCMDSLIAFDAAVGTDEITRVDWNFGDGISESSTAKTQHEYTSPGWYDVVADLYGHQVCTDESEQFLGTVQFSFRVVQPVIYFDTIKHQCLTPEEQEADPALCAKLVAEGMNDTIWPGPDSCWADIPIIRYDYGLITVQYDTIKAQDFYYEPYNSITYPINPNNQEDYIVDLELNLTDLLGIKNNTDCDIILRRHIEIVTCLEMYIQNDPASQTACYGETMEIPYKHVKGEIGKASVTINGKTEEISMDYGAATLPVSALKPGRYSATITVEDPICNQVLQFPVDVMVKYPEDIFQYKFNNVLAVYKPGYGGNEEGFIFTAYQWYVNNQPIEGATESIYHVADGTFNKGDIVYVMLTNKEGETIPSCPQTITDVPPFDTNQQAAPAHKLMLNKRILIRKGEMLFDIYGQRVE